MHQIRIVTSIQTITSQQSLKRQKHIIDIYVKTRNVTENYIEICAVRKKSAFVKDVSIK